jgi:Na+-driven multidrug efflux pump
MKQIPLDLNYEGCEKVKMNNYINLFKQWIFGIILLILSPFIILLGILSSIVFKLPIWIFLLFNEFWLEHRKKKNE